MDNRINFITSIIEQIPNIAILRNFSEEYGKILGRIKVLKSENELEFEVEINPQYPLQFHETESIRFLNLDYITSNHVNRDGSICIHTKHNPDIKEKLEWDFNSLKEWIKTYYLQNGKDDHYEHIVVGEYHATEPLSCHLFTDVKHNFAKNTFGTFTYSIQAVGREGQKERHTFLVHNFIVGKVSYECSWSKFYNERQFSKGIYVYVETPPVKHKRFAVDTWLEFEPFVSQEFLKFLYDIDKKGIFKRLGIKKLPLLIGYKIPTEEVHWQCAMINTENFPNESVRFENGYGGQFKDLAIEWSSTKNCSYKYFFGRGKFSEKITEKKILIIGIGAVGSIVATTLTRGGCKFLTLVDYDVKEPENVCRSEYDFNTGINNKVLDLGSRLVRISPFIEIIPDVHLMDSIKYFVNNKASEPIIKSRIEEFDIIIDCTTDDDVVYILDSLDLSSEIISLSITNNAKELLCSVKPNLYEWLIKRDTFIPKSNEPLHVPTGCWNPTFKASYNDISALVQFALKHINLSLESGKGLRHFFLSADTETEFKIKLHQF